MNRWRILDAVAAWGLILLGCLHNFLAAPRIHLAAGDRLFWFVGTGLALWYAGALNLARQSAGPVLTVRAASLLANVTLLAFVVAFGVHTDAIRRPDGVLLVALVSVATLFSADAMFRVRSAAPRAA